MSLRGIFQVHVKQGNNRKLSVIAMYSTRNQPFFVYSEILWTEMKKITATYVGLYVYLLTYSMHWISLYSE